MKKAPFIVIDGGDGAGKSTQLELLQKQYSDALFTREPGGTPYAELNRKAVLSPEAKDVSSFPKILSFFSGRADHLESKVRPALEQGVMVITDRFDSSSFAYQLWGTDRQDLIPQFKWLREEVVSICPPDLYVYLDVDPEVGMKRQVDMKKVDMNYFDHSSVAEMNKRREGYLEFFKLIPEKHYIIDANQSIEEVYAELFGVIEELRAA